MQYAIDYLLNYYLQNEYGKELKEKLSFYLGKPILNSTINTINHDFTNFLHQKLNYNDEGIDILRLNPQVSVMKNRTNPNELTIRFYTAPALPVTEGYH